MPEILIKPESTKYQESLEQIQEGPDFDEYELNKLREAGSVGINLRKRQDQLEDLDDLTPEQVNELNLINSIEKKQLQWERTRQKALHNAIPEENIEHDAQNEPWLTEHTWDQDRTQDTLEPPFNSEQIRLYLALILPKPLRKFFEEQCVLRFSTTQLEPPGFPIQGGPRADLQAPEHTGGIQVKREDYGESIDKFVLHCDSFSFMQYTPEGARYMNLNQFGLTFAKTLLQLVPREKDGKEVPELRDLSEALEGGKGKKHGKVIAGEAEDDKTIDFLALYAVDKEAAKRFSEEAFEKARGYFVSLEKLDRHEFAETAHATLNRYNNELWQQRFALNKDLQKEMARAEVPGDWVANKLLTPVVGLFSFGKRQAYWRGFYKTDWYERAKAELDDKEMARILKRDVHVTIRDQELKQAIQFHDRDSARWLLLADANTSDYMTWRMNLYLYHFDDRFRQTSGKEITKDSFDLLMRLHRISYKNKMLGAKPGEYTLSKDGNYGVLISFEEQVHNAFEELNKFSARNVMGVADEMWEWMKHLKDGHYIHFEEMLGHGDPNDPHYWSLPTGDLREMTNDPNGFMAFMERARGVTGDEKFGTKLDAFRWAVLAYCHHMALTEKGYPTHEHSPPASAEALAYYGEYRPREVYNDDKYTKKTSAQFVQRYEEVYQRSPYKGENRVGKLFEVLKSSDRGRDQQLDFMSEPYQASYAVASALVIGREFGRASRELNKGKVPDREATEDYFASDAKKPPIQESQNKYAVQKIWEASQEILPENEEYPDENRLSKIRGDLMLSLRTNAPDWYHENQYAAQRYVGEMIGSVSDLREAVEVKKKIDPYVEEAEEVYGEEHAKELDEMVKTAEVALKKKEPISEAKTLKLSPKAENALKRVGVSTEELNGALSRNMTEGLNVDNLKRMVNEAKQEFSHEVMKDEVKNIWRLAVQVQRLDEGLILPAGAETMTEDEIEAWQQGEFERLREEFFALPTVPEGKKALFQLTSRAQAFESGGVAPDGAETMTEDAVNAWKGEELKRMRDESFDLQNIPEEEKNPAAVPNIDALLKRLEKSPDAIADTEALLEALKLTRFGIQRLVDEEEARRVAAEEAARPKTKPTDDDED